ncbi:MAG: family 20 glycosylhydrolase [Thomasclavelia spiroformis]
MENSLYWYSTNSFVQKINLTESYTTTKVRLVINDFFDDSPLEDGSPMNYPTVSLYEVQMYDRELVIEPEDVVTVDDIAANITSAELSEDGSKLIMPTVPTGYEISFVGADYEQILARDMTVSKPLTTQDVELNFEVTETKTGEKAISPAINVTIPGIYDEETSQNAKPKVIPELQQWYGETGVFEINDNSRIVVDPAVSQFEDTANKFAADYLDILDKNIPVVIGTDPKAGDFYFTTSEETLDKETYVLDIDNYVTIKATENTGAYWATRTILQVLKQTGNQIQKGITKDYPKYEVRGFMLDVARKSFQMDFLEELVKTMSWYKLNNFHVHLNDNCFGKLEDGKTPDYSAFRLESDIPNLTNTDLYYTKDEFRSFILNSREVGVDIVPEFDSPGHSGAFVRARPDLARADSNEYLDVENPEALEFIKSVFAEYTSGDNPVFPKGTVIQIGTDEYKRGNKEAFRKYQDELLKFIRDEQGYTPRVWGQTENEGTTPITVDGVQMNLWYVGYANPREMYEKGYKCINSNDGDLYIVPGAGYYYDYLNQSHIHSTWQPNKIGNFTIPVGDDQMLGSTFHVWNDKMVHQMIMVLLM